MEKRARLVTALNAVTDDTTSSAINIQGASKVTLMLTRSNNVNGSSLYSVDVSLDGTTYVDYNMLIDNATNTNAQNLTRVATKLLQGNTSGTVCMDLANAGYAWIKVAVDETTDGTHTAKVLIEY